MPWDVDPTAETGKGLERASQPVTRRVLAQRQAHAAPPSWRILGGELLTGAFLYVCSVAVSIPASIEIGPPPIPKPNALSTIYCSVDQPLYTIVKSVDTHPWPLRESLLVSRDVK